MQRPPVACRRAVNQLDPSLPQYIWISDDLLSRVFRHFVHNRCIHQRRHGSHVPGPLEARRRGLKRRMTAVASPNTGAPIPPLFNFGALFRYPSSPEPSFKYQPPSLHNRQDALGPFPLDEVKDAACSSLSQSDLYPEPPQPPPTPNIDSQTPLHQEPEPDLPHARHIIADAEPSSPMLKSKTLHEGSHTNSLNNDTQIHEENNLQSGRLENSPKSEEFTICLKHFTSILHSVKAKDKKGGVYPTSSLFADLRHCYPNGSGAGDFSFSAVDSLTRFRWASEDIIMFLSSPDVPLPKLDSQRSIKFVKQLLKMSSTLDIVREDLIPILRKVFQKLAVNANSESSTNKPLGDAALGAVYRAIWERQLNEKYPTRLDLIDADRNSLHLFGKLFDDPFLGSNLRRLHNDQKSAVKLITDLMTIKTISRQERISHLSLLLNCIPRRLLNPWIVPVSTRLHASWNWGKPVSENHALNTFKTRFMAWLKILRCLDQSFADPNAIPFTAMGFEGLVVRKCQPSELGHWFLPQEQVYFLLSWLPYLESVREIPSQRVNSFIKEHYKFLALETNSRLDAHELLADLLVRLFQAKIPNHGVAKMILYYYYPEKRGRIIDILEHLVNQKTSLSSFKFLYQFISKIRQQAENESNKRDLHFASHLKHVVSKLYSIDKFSSIITRAQKSGLLPAVYANQPMTILLKKDVELVHQIAHQYSIDYTRSALQASRSIYGLYWYLALRQHAIGPLFTRALVRTALMRPLMENRFVSSRTLIWVCNRVAEVEGEDVARKVEYSFWVFRGEIILNAKGKWDEVGGVGKAHVNTMRRLGLV
ncbi:hypothetical protein CC78DRAFT_571500 [Lojkania enalia]|uniref:Uncharacterized protein n=1 Tax=Lojkania enalia TaxID=147567 RepID=A0A9P4N2N7_9PLEO|nr:hypothetical protein CC78DRAFT_571500 [Didymosphaeria enalia]